MLFLSLFLIIIFILLQILKHILRDICHGAKSLRVSGRYVGDDFFNIKLVTTMKKW